MNPYKGQIRLSTFDNLLVSIYVIGYKNIGESIAVLFHDKAKGEEDVVFSFVVDSYKKDGLFLTKKILDDNKVKSLDMVFWTHPHRDHTPGVDEIVKDYFKQEMLFFKPKFYFGNLCEDLLKDESKFTAEANLSLEKFFEQEVKDYDGVRTITGEGDVTNHYPIQMIEDSGQTKDLLFYFLTPIGRLVDQYSLKGNMLSRPNDLSISFVMSIDGYDFYFGGDAEGDHCMSIETPIVKDMRWIKVPHHCSNGGKYVCDHLGPRFDFAASTVYASSDLPKEDIQNAYASHGSLFMTQLKNEKLEHEYGVVRFDYKFKGENTEVSIFTYGNAQEYLLPN